jgi:hypothetical protein
LWGARRFGSNLRPDGRLRWQETPTIDQNLCIAGVGEQRRSLYGYKGVEFALSRNYRNVGGRLLPVIVTDTTRDQGFGWPTAARSFRIESAEHSIVSDPGSIREAGVPMVLGERGGFFR